jgi:hypothetical protein
MRVITRLATALIGLGLLVTLTAAPAAAIFPQLDSKLSGPAIGGRTPVGEARLDQSGYPVEPSRLEVRARNVNLPDGTVLAVAIEGTPVGSLTLSRGEGRLATTIAFQVGRQSPITVVHNGAVILRGTWRS